MQRKQYWVLLIVGVLAGGAYAAPNFVVLSVHQPNELSCIDDSKSYTARAVVKNSGDSEAGASTTRLNVWGQAYFVETASIPAGGTRVVQAETSPFEGICQNYTIKVSADVHGVVVESNEDDNVRFAPYTLTLCDCPGAPTFTPTTAPTPTATNTPVPATMTPTETVTSTAIPPSETPTATSTSTPTRTATASSSPTSTEVAPTATPSRTATVTSTVVPGTMTPTHTSTPAPTSTVTNTRTATATPTGTTIAGPNLRVLEVQQPLPEGDFVDPSVVHTGRVFVFNSGTEAAGPTITRVNMWGLQHLLETPELSPNELFVLEFDSEVFVGAECRELLIRAIADYNDSVDETNESDNVGEAAYTLFLVSCSEATMTPTGTISPTITPTRTVTATATQTMVPPTATPTATEGEVTPTPTATTEPFGCDSGYYVLDSFGGRHKAGSPPAIMGSLYFGADIARDIDRVQVNGEEDLLVLDKYGAVHFVAHSNAYIPQDFFFLDDLRFPRGRAVDMVVTEDNEGVWVLTDYGRIYRAGSAKDSDAESELIIPAIDGLLGWDIPTPNLHLSLPTSAERRASLRAVSLVVIDVTGDSQAEGYIMFDSQGGHWQINPDGTLVTPGIYSGASADHPQHLLDPSSYAYPFYPGLDILRDAELHPSQQGLVLFDGWGGIHPVPVDRPSNPVFFTRNEDPNNLGTPLEIVGMPYIVMGFDNPTTHHFNESIGVDSGSIFNDFEFSLGCPNTGFWTLDRFGAVYVFGSLRANPNDISSPMPGGSYFFPNPFGEKMAVFPR